MLETTAHQWDGGWGKGLKVRYETSLDITDVPVLRVEADSIWATLRPSAERDSICSGAPGTLELAGQTVIPLRSYDDLVV